MTEIWKAVAGYEEFYQVSNLGNVRSLDRKVWNGHAFYNKPGRVLKPISVGKYQGVQIAVNGKSKKFYIHRLVAKAFIENPLKKETVNHIDGNKLNNNVKNLEWVTQGENLLHAINNGLRKTIGEEHYMCKYSNKTIIKMRADYETGNYTQADISRKYGVSRMQAHRILTYKLRKDII